MVKIDKVKISEIDYARIRDTSFGRSIQYYFKLDKFTAKQWLEAHNAIMSNLEALKRAKMTNKQIKQLAFEWLNSPKNLKIKAKKAGISVKHLETNAEINFETVLLKYIEDFCRPELNSETSTVKARRQCGIILDFLRSQGISEYSQLRREILAEYPEWRTNNRLDGRKNTTSADTINKELNRLAAIIKFGVKFCGWQERYLLDGIRVKQTMENTKSIRPFEIEEVKTILKWLYTYSESIDNWHLHDMILLALCTGLEAKALDLLEKYWFKPDLGIIRVYDKLVSGVIDAKTQNRARDIPLTPTTQKLLERDYIFMRPKAQRKPSQKGGTAFAAWAESILRKAERETGIVDINLHRFRHTCATARLSAGWQLIRVSRMLGHSNINTTAQYYAEYDLSASSTGFEGMVKVYTKFLDWLDKGYF